LKTPCPIQFFHTLNLLSQEGSANNTDKPPPEFVPTPHIGMVRRVSQAPVPSTILVHQKSTWFRRFTHAQRNLLPAKTKGTAAASVFQQDPGETSLDRTRNSQTVLLDQQT